MTDTQAVIPLRVLLLEDNVADADLVIAQLSDGGFAPQWHRVDNGRDFAAALDSPRDVILADFALPQFSALRALAELERRGAGVPLIVVSGSVGDELAAECIKAGAVDYLLKDRLGRLGTAVRLALERRDLAVRRRQAEEDVQRERQLMRMLIDQIPDPVYVKDRSSRFQLVNQALVRLMGAREPAEVLGKTDAEYFPAHRAAKFRADEQRVFAGESILNQEESIIAAGGRPCILLTTKLPLHNRAGEITALVGIGRDITARKEAEQRRALEHAVTRVLAEAATAPDVNRRILETLCAGLGSDYAELWTVDRARRTIECREMWHRRTPELGAFGDDSAMLCRTGQAGLAGRVWASRTARWSPDIANDPDCMRRDAAARAGLRSWTGFPIKLREEFLGVVGCFSSHGHELNPEMLETLTNIGIQLGQFFERQHLTAQFRQAQKLESIGTLAGGIAHDFNNILAAIAGYTELAKMSVKDPTVRGYLGSVSDASVRATSLVKQILAFSRKEQPQRMSIQLRQVVAESLKLLRASIPSTVEFDVALPKETAPVLADPTQVHQLIMNLATNAWHAMRDRPGRMVVRVEDLPIDAHVAATSSGLKPGPYIHISVTDTGCGMDRATMERIFEPFFTTKPAGEGTGLGLSVVHGIMRSHDGAVTVQSEPGRGTTFHLYFPAHTGAAAQPVATAAEIPRGEGQRILFVDDEAPLAGIGEILLKQLGYVATSCAKPAEALDLIRADPTQFDLLITDFTMPGMTGVDLADAAHRICAELPIILMTGYTVGLTLERLQPIGVCAVLPKPQSTESLARTVYEVLAGRRGAHA